MYFDWRRIGLVATLTDQGGQDMTIPAIIYSISPSEPTRYSARLRINPTTKRTLDELHQNF